MKVLTVSATDRYGGAAIAAYRTHKALLSAGMHSDMLVWRKLTSDPSVHRVAPRMDIADRVKRRLASARHERSLRRVPRVAESAWWSLNNFDYPLSRSINDFRADIAHLHWVGDNYLPVEQLAGINAPVVWTLHDMNAFTGGCHYAGDCVRYRESCGNCPQLAAPSPKDVSARTHRRKRESWSRLPLTIVCPSAWLADRARESALFKHQRIEVIGNPIDPKVFKPLDQHMARRAFNLPQGKRLLLFGGLGGSADPRKGFSFLRRALEGLRAQDIEVVVFGGEKGEALDLPLPAHHIGVLHDEVSLCLLYAACDAFSLPTLQDNLPNTLLEALACGTPCIAFDVGGVPDLVRHGETGFLAKAEDADDLRRAINWTLAQDWSPAQIHQAIVERYAPARIADQYRQLYESMRAVPS